MFGLVDYLQPGFVIFNATEKSSCNEDEKLYYTYIRFQLTCFPKPYSVTVALAKINSNSPLPS